MLSPEEREELLEILEHIPRTEYNRVRAVLEVFEEQPEPITDEDFVKFLHNCPIDDEPETEDDLEATRRAREDILAGKVYPLEDVLKEHGI